MGVEQPPGKETLRRGELYFLSHPGSELFSGYGVTDKTGRPDRLVGLLMVDRPAPVDPRWLAQIEHLYGDYELVTMTDAGERGLLAQMRIAPESLSYLAQLPPGQVANLSHALQPLLDEPPAPVLKLRWDADLRLWESRFWFGLPPALQEVFERTGYGCFSVERADGVSFVTHLSDADIESVRSAPVLHHWELVEMPTAALIRFRAAFLDDLQNPYILEHFLNLDDPEQARCLSRLVRQEEIVFDFFGRDYEYRYSRHLAHPEEMRAYLSAAVRRAIEVYGEIPRERRDFDRAKDEFQRRFPI